MCFNAQEWCEGGGGVRANTNTALLFMQLEMEICHHFSIQSFERSRRRNPSYFLTERNKNQNTKTGTKTLVTKPCILSYFVRRAQTV